MKKIDLELKYCYGINQLTHSFNFEDSKSHIIYAPNGVMKTSLAKTFEDTYLNISSKDRLFKRESFRKIKVDGRDIIGSEIFVINRLKPSEFKDASTILANPTLRKEFNKLNKEIKDSKNRILKKIQVHIGLREKFVEKTIKEVFQTDIYTFLDKKHSDILNIENPTYKDILFKEVFNAKTENFLNKKSFNIKIEEYIQVYDKLFSLNTHFFKKGHFNHFNADAITKSLDKNGFFEAKHKLLINEAKVDSVNDLKELIKLEKEKILSNPELVSKFTAIDKELNANIDLRKFRAYLEQNQEIIRELIDINSFKQKLILDYFAVYKEELKDFISLYTQNKVKLQNVISQANKEQKQWKSVLEIFKNRFSVPFEISIENQEDVILKGEPPVLAFTYNDGVDEEKFKGEEIKEILSTGEQRVFYILNIIFEIETRKLESQNQVIIVDDIADSFDYKNKYAIIEYLNDVANFPKFNAIILTHNFDFYRTVKKRLGSVCNWRGNWKAIKTMEKIILVHGEKNDVFPHLRDNYPNCKKSFIACIPFVRNLIEFTIGRENDDYSLLTALLHVKPSNPNKNIQSTKNITVGKVLEVFNRIFSLSESVNNPDDKIYEQVIATADELCGNADEVLDLKSKLCLSMAIRYKTEDFIINKITDTNFHLYIHTKVTGKIIEQYKRDFSNETEKIKIFERVSLMTAENIHVNSFMYEPLVDLSETHLKKLYKDVSKL